MATTITDEQAGGPEPPTRMYTAVILKHGPNRHADDADAVIEQHGRSIRQLRADGLLSIVCHGRRRHRGRRHRHLRP